MLTGLDAERASFAASGDEGLGCGSGLLPVRRRCWSHSGCCGELKGCSEPAGSAEESVERQPAVCDSP